MNAARSHPENSRRAIIMLLLMAGVLFGAAGCAQTRSSIATANETARFGSHGVRVHDPSTIIRCKDEHWFFYTGRGIPSYHSKDLTGWKRGPSVFANAPAWVVQAVPANHWMYYWAPDVIHLGDRYFLYYAVSSFGDNRSAIGLATNPTLDPADSQFQWMDRGIVVQSAKTDDFNAIDPAVSLDANGNMWLAFGSFWSGIKLIQLDPKTGKRMTADSPMYSLAFNDSIEAPYIYHHSDYYYLFVNWGLCCRGTNSTYEIRVGRSQKITGPYLDKDGVNLLLGGGSLFLGSTGTFIGPGQTGIISEGSTNWFSCHFYDGTRHGASSLTILPLHWNADGWPALEVPREK